MRQGRSGATLRRTGRINLRGRLARSPRQFKTPVGGNLIHTAPHQEKGKLPNSPLPNLPMSVARYGNAHA